MAKLSIVVMRAGQQPETLEVAQEVALEDTIKRGGAYQLTQAQARELRRKLRRPVWAQ